MHSQVYRGHSDRSKRFDLLSHETVLELPTPSSRSVILTFCSILVGFMVLVCGFSLLVSRFLSVSGIELFVSRGAMEQYFLVEIY